MFSVETANKVIIANTILLFFIEVVEDSFDFFFHKLVVEFDKRL